MLKNIIFLICLLSCSHTFFTAEKNSIDLVYKDLKKIYERNKKNNRYEINKHIIDSFLSEHTVSIQDVYDMLNKKEEIFRITYNQLNHELELIPWKQPEITPFIAQLPYRMLSIKPKYHSEGSISMAMGDMVTDILYFGAWVIGMPLLLSGIGIQHYTNPSTIKNVVSLGLMATGGLLSLPGNFFGLLALIATIEDKLNTIVFKLKRRIPLQQRDNTLAELHLIQKMIKDLQRLYPELQTK